MCIKNMRIKTCMNLLSAYGIKTHRHNSEIQQELDIEIGKKVEFNFTPHLSPMFRGILTTIYCNVTKKNNVNSILNLLKNFIKMKCLLK